MSDETRIELLNEDGIGLYVDCQWQVDRFVHIIGLQANNQTFPILRSHEDQSDEFWPSSPPLQQLSKQLMDEGPVLLGLGMAGKNHFSTSFLLRDDSAVELLVESACSLHAATIEENRGTESLGTAYDLQPGAGMQLSAANDITFELDSAEVSGSTSLTVHRGSLGEISQSEESSLRIHPTEIITEKPTQWSYRFILRSGDVSNSV